MQTVYFDESGFTGSNLMHPEQPVFVYASVAIEPDHASYLHSEVIRRFRIDENELKGKKLVKKVRGRKAISWLFKECKDISRVSISHKKYCLACKFFEYIFEPVLAPRSSIFYHSGFHEFIATFLYFIFTARRTYAEDIFREFEAFIRTKDLSHFEDLLSPAGSGIDPSDPLRMILTFAFCHRERIAQEIKGFADLDSVSKWALDLTTGALFGLLSFWGQRFKSLDVYCDRSKPLETDSKLFNVMIGRKDRVSQRIGNREFIMTFNLAGPIRLVDSSAFPGIQIADILASSIASALKNPEDEESRLWLSLAQETFDDTCVFPDPNKFDLNRRAPFVNCLILHELVDRTVERKDLFEGMDEFIEIAGKAYEQNLLMDSYE